ncbi:TIGR02300 family protein [Phenylobacterium kunshanense]|uniref:TIGR02300 family protein n=1 Tax=Phenylobacterium kunshanense TaxID=1445034 RepID=A0A328BEN9_9CAUL|nr:TIGR02300 family protein [Phenylobacterium kunshanense]RAK64921.1 TIGR02300 family protein [Phenylobacterium kunshanense]
MANPELGTKQICPTCQAKFYDLNKRPAHCPKCHSEFDPDEAVRNRRVRARSIVPDTEEAEDQVVEKETDDEEEEDVATPELDEVADEPPLVTDDDDDGADGSPAVSEDLGEFTDDEDVEDADDVPFLEDEDEDDFDESEIEGLPDGGDDDR